MSDIGSTFFTIANALVSPKAITKFLSIAFSLILTWKYISPELSELGIPVEHFSFIILLIGIGLGTLLGIIIYWICESLFDIYKKKQKVKLDIGRRELEKKRNEEEWEIRNVKLATKLEASIDYLGIDDKEILYLLSQTNTTIKHREYNESVLLDNEYIQIISRVDEARVLVKLNPALLDVVRVNFEHYKRTEVELFFKSQKNAEYFLELLDVNNSEETTPVHFDVLKDLSANFGQINGTYQLGIGFFLSFNRFMLEAFEENTEKKYSEELLIPIARIINTSPS